MKVGCITLETQNVQFLDNNSCPNLVWAAMFQQLVSMKIVMNISWCKSMSSAHDSKYGNLLSHEWETVDYAYKHDTVMRLLTSLLLMTEFCIFWWIFLSDNLWRCNLLKFTTCSLIIHRHFHLESFILALRNSILHVYFLLRFTNEIHVKAWNLRLFPHLTFSSAILLQKNWSKPWWFVVALRVYFTQKKCSTITRSDEFTSIHFVPSQP